MKHDVLVIGGGISGITVAVEAAECGRQVLLVEKEAYLGGRVARLNKYFPKLCPPACGMEINYRRLRTNSNITIKTLSEVTAISGKTGDFEVTVKTHPRFVNDRCVACDDCVKVCPVSRPDAFNYGLSKTKAIYLPHEMAMPMKYVIDMDTCKGETCAECVKACKYDAIELKMGEQSASYKVGSVVFATGWKPYDASKIANLGYGQVANVINNVEMERLAAPNGPTQGKLRRRDNGEPVKTVAFVQCAGSRDENHLPYCSSICCMASLKQATYVREQAPDAQIYVFYIDMRTPGKYEAFYKKLQADGNVHFVNGKVARIDQDAEGHAVVTAEDILGGGKIRVACDLVVLATGMEPAFKPKGMNVSLDEFGFVVTDADGQAGVFSTGVARQPIDVTMSIQDATGVALQTMRGRQG